jgi:hypothetical protein
MCQPCTDINLCARVEDLRPAPTLNCQSAGVSPPQQLICVSRVQNVSLAQTQIRVRMQDISHAQTLICVSMNPCINQMNIILIQQMQSSVLSKASPLRLNMRRNMVILMTPQSLRVDLRSMRRGAPQKYKTPSR